MLKDYGMPVDHTTMIERVKALAVKKRWKSNELHVDTMFAYVINDLSFAALEGSAGDVDLAQIGWRNNVSKEVLQDPASVDPSGHFLWEPVGVSIQLADAYLAVCEMLVFNKQAVESVSDSVEIAFGAYFVTDVLLLIKAALHAHLTGRSLFVILQLIEMLAETHFIDLNEALEANMAYLAARP